MRSFAAALTLLATSAFVSAVPGDYGAKWTSECKTTSTCSTELCTETYTKEKPSTYVETITTYVPVTATKTTATVIVKTSEIPEHEYKTETVTKTYTATNTVTSWATKCTTYPVTSKSLCPETTKVIKKVPYETYSPKVYSTTKYVPCPYTTKSASLIYSTCTTEVPYTTTKVETESKCYTSTYWTSWQYKPTTSSKAYGGYGQHTTYGGY